MNQRYFAHLGALLLAGLLLVTFPVYADDPEPDNVWALLGEPLSPVTEMPDRSQYNLFNREPDDQLRSFVTDRPGKTHSAITVDPGHYQIESDLINYTYDHYSPDHQTTNNYSAPVPLLKAGIVSWADLEAGFSLYNNSRVTDRTAGTTVKGSGSGDVLLGSKMNIFGNDGGAQSLAVLPFIKLPTAANTIGNGVTEYTLNVPYNINLDTLWSLTLEPQFGLLKNTMNKGLHGDYAFFANLNRPVFFKTVTGAVELAADYSSDRNVTPTYTFDPSLQWLVTPALQLDLGAYIGLNRAAPDFNPYLGISTRF